MKTVEDIIIEKDYAQLSQEELILVGELVDSEQEYNEMKAFFNSINTIEVNETINPEIKSSLNSIFQSKHPGIHQNWKAAVEVAKPVIPIYRKTWFQVAALLVLIFGIVTIWMKSTPELEMQRDTVVAENKITENKGKSAPQKEETLVLDSTKQITATVAPEIVETEPETTFRSPYNEYEQEVVAPDDYRSEYLAVSPIARGRNADLHPGVSSYGNDIEVSNETLLSLIEPSF